MQAVLATALFSIAVVTAPGERPQHDSSESAAQGEAVLLIDGEEVLREDYVDWLLQARGELYAPLFVRLWSLRQQGAEHGVRFDASLCRDLAQAEVDQRLESAFNGDRGPWLLELRREDRTPEGWLAQRALGIEGEKLLEALEEKTGRSYRDLLAAADRDFTFHRETALRREPEAPVLTIADATISRAEFCPWLLAAFGELDAGRRAETLRIESAARAAEIVVTDEQVQARNLSDLEVVIEHDYHGDRDAFVQELAATGRSEDQFLREFAFRKRYDLLVERLILRERQVSDAEVRAAWEERYGPAGRTVELRWIRIDAAPAEDLSAARAEAQELRGRLEEGQDFATLAELHSDDGATRARGGRPQAGFRLDRLPEPLVAAVLALGPGTLSEPLVHGRSVWLFEVTAVRDTPYGDVREQLLADLRQRRPTEVEIAAKRLQVVRDVEVRVLPRMFE